MANEKPTVFQRLRNVMISMGAGSSEARRQPVSYDIQMPQSEVLYAFDNKEARDQKLLQLKQQKLLSYQWRKNGYESSMAALAGSTQVRVMYRDVDLMDQWPEIHSGLDILSEEATTLKKGKMLNVYSKSERIKAVLEDLFVNRLDIMMMLPMITRDTCKYGNEFMFLNIDQNEGIIGWRRLDVYSMRRLENGIENAYGGPAPSANLYNLKPDEVKFIWEGHNEQTPYQSWQVAHFRLIKDSIFLPYGISYLNGARRHWRMLSMLEDAIFLHRLERSVERRIFKVNVGNIDEADVLDNESFDRIQQIKKDQSFFSYIEKEEDEPVLYENFLIENKCIKAATIRQLIKGRKFQELDRKFRQDLLAMDGATVIGYDGTIIAVGAIIKIEAGSSGGGRLAAARTLSNYGVSIKISNDGSMQGFKMDRNKLRPRTIFVL